MTGRPQGLANLRDVGGLPLVGGGVTADGVLYRADAPYPGDRAVPELAAWPPASILDLRGARERVRFPFVWPAGTDSHHLPVHSAAAPDAQPRDLPAVYLRMLDGADAWAPALLDHVTRPAGPVLLHCTAGKDRTGVAVAVLLLAAGVRSDAVVADYVRSDETLPALHDRWLSVGVRTAQSPPLPEEYMRAPAAAIEPIVERLTESRGGAAQWVLERGVDRAVLERWQARLTARDQGRSAE
ncbi:tyrosine-protein phosphatase [Tomitella biformata]|uniref:tyrosine-protein phosphatase n=1 Tax=Tomitella biformata TaxID=630403 RepID=UPI000466F521|nr:tyrosine-protein phosphatase [Tomitella biformata]